MFRLSGLKRGGLHISLLTCSKLALIHESFSWNHGLEKSNIIRYFDIHSGQISPEYFPKMSKENGLIKTYFLSKPEVLDFVLLKYYHFPHKNPQNSGYHCKTPKYLWSEFTLKLNHTRILYSRDHKSLRELWKFSVWCNSNSPKQGPAKHQISTISVSLHSGLA